MSSRVDSKPEGSGPATVESVTAGSIRRFLLDPGLGWPGSIALWAAAVLMVVSGGVHVYLWHLAYRHVATLGPLFLVQAVAAFVLAVVLALSRRGVFLVAGLALMTGTIVGFILVTTVGLFNFTLKSITGWADLALAAEAGAIVGLLVGARLLWQACNL